MNGFALGALVAVNVVLIALMANSWLSGRKVMKQQDERYRQYVADMEAVGRRFRADPPRADSESTSNQNGQP